MMGFSIRAACHAGRAIGRLLATSIIILACAVTAPLAQGPPGPDPVYDAQGFQPNRDYYSPLPFEHIDTVSGNVLLKFTDLTLPGNAGISLSFVRSINLKGQAGPFEVGLPKALPWGLEGLPLVVRRTIPVVIPDTSPQQFRMPTFQTADGGNHPTRWFQPFTFGTGDVMMTKEFWRYTASTRKLELPDGLVLAYDMVVPAVAGGFDAFLTSVTNPFDNSVASVTLDWTGNRLVKVRQNPGTSEEREVSLSYAEGAATVPVLAHPASMSYAGRTWTYVLASPNGGVTEAHPPVGPPWIFGGGSVTTPHGGKVTYTFALFQLLSGKTSERPNSTFTWKTMLSQRTTEGPDISGGTWNFNWTDASPGMAQVTITGQARTIKYENTWLEAGPVTTKRTVQSGGTDLETETLQYSDYLLFQGPGDGGFENVPVLDQRQVVRGSKTYTTTYSYSSSDFKDYLHPNVISEAGDLSRTTTVSYEHGFTPYIRACVASATVAVGGQSYTRSFDYNLQTGFVNSRTVYNVTTSYAPTAHGNVGTVTDANGNATTFSYEWGVLKNVWTPEYPGGPTITRTINPDGTVATETRRGFETLFGYDNNGRPTSVRPHPGYGDTTNATYDLSSGGMRWMTVARGSESTTTTLDGFGRPVATQDSAGVKTRTAYDAEGRKTYQSYPYEGSDDKGDEFTLDALNRLVKVTHEDNSFVEVSYPNGDTEIIDELAHPPSSQARKTTQHWQAFGDPSDARLTSLTDPDGNVWNYSYTALGALAGVDPPGTVPGRSWSYTPDKHRLEYDIQPESGRTDYTLYDNVGNLKSKTDANGTTTAYTYDANNRLKKIEAPNEVVDIWYDESNNRTRVRNAVADSTFTYDGANRLTGRSDVLDGRTLATAYQYDGRDILTGIDYPSGRHVTYTPNAHGRITSVTGPGGITYANSVQYHPSGAISGLTFGNSATESVTFDTRQRPAWLRSGPLDVFYQYDDVGNVLSIDDARGFDFDSSFFYDKLDRLTAITDFGAREYTYDALGNRRTKHDATGWVTYSYDEAKQRLSSIDDWPYNGALVYDPAGNLTTDPVGTYGYTPFNLMKTATVTINSVITNYGYAYDGDNLRVRKVSPEGTKYYVHGAGSQLLAEYDEVADGVELVREYVYLGSKLLASASRSAAPAPVGRVTGVSPAPLSAAAGTSVAVTVTGATQSCSSVQVDFGDGTVTTYNVPSQTLPLVVNHTYAAAGIYTVIARGQSPCLGTISSPLEVASGNVVDNGDFTQADGAPIGWGTYTQGGEGYFNVTQGVLNFYRTQGMTQAVVLQYTGLALPTAAPLELTFRMGNSDTVRKRLTVMIHTPGFDDLAMCTFWLDPNQPLVPPENAYVMRMHTTKAWADATASFYAADVNASGSTGAYQLDDVSLNYRPALSSAKTDCVDPLRPTSGGIAADGFISNGDFAAGTASWSLTGQLTSQVAAATLEFYRISGSPAPLIAQSTGTTMAQDQRLAAVFELGNTSTTRQRVTVTLQDTSSPASDFTSCVFWLAPGTTKQFYAMTTYATQAWANATITIAPTVTGTSPTHAWLQLDTVSLAKITDPILGTECFEPGSFTLGGGPAPVPEPVLMEAAMAATAPLLGTNADLVLTFALERDEDEGARIGGPTTPPAVALALSIAGSGSGAVTSSPAGVTCGGQGVACTGWFVESTTVTLTAVADAGTTFAGWFGACEGTGTCVVSMVGAQAVTALFSGPMALTYYHLDALGSVRAVTDTAGATVQRHDYFAFGEDPAPMTGDPIRFTGKELDAETALTYSAARYYRSSLGRFSTADPFNLAGRRTNPQTWNAYSYALNNPLRFVDPSGLWSEPIHRWIIQHAFPGLSPAQQKIMIEASKRMDSVRSHFPGEEYKHGLRAPGQSKADAQRLHLAYVVERQDTAMLFFDYGFTDAGLAVAAQAVHAVVDPTSPMHEDYQLWNLGDGKSTGRHSGGETWAAFTAARRVQAIGAAQRAMGNMMGLAEFLKATGLRFEVFVSETYKIKPDGK